MEKDFRDVFIERLDAAADRLAYSFTSDNGTVQEASYARLLRRAVEIGAAIGAHARAGDRVVMLLKPGIDYVASFIGCWIHGFVSVPAYPPRKNQRASRTESIIASAQPSVVLLDESDEAASNRWASSGVAGRPRCVFLSDVRPGASPAIDLDRYIADTMAGGSLDDIVFLQYTSGSTGVPKGTMVSHDNLIHNSRQMSRKFRTGPASTMVSWLPPYHDMGLILGILQPVYIGFPAHLMAPAVFMQRPLQWLRLIAQTRATISGGPNFAFELCVRRSAEIENERLDLSTWDVAFNGAEPINPATLRSFAKTFERHGFNARALHPCYGLAENTLMATGQDRVANNDESPQCYFASAAADRGAADKEIVGCGSSIPGEEIVIVNPVTCEPVPEGATGEIWITGRSVAKGYWRNDIETAATFHATLAGDVHGPRYLRTGDLGEMRAGDLYIRGRLKDIIIVRGMKYYPQDIERVIEAAHPQIRHGGYCAVFQSDEIEPESVAVVAEIARQHRRLDREELATTIRAVVADEFRLRVSSVSILQPGRFPKTSSGKIPRNAIKNELLESERSIA